MIITHVEYVVCPNTPEGRLYAKMVESEFSDRLVRFKTETTTTSITVGYEESTVFRDEPFKNLSKPFKEVRDA